MKIWIVVAVVAMLAIAGLVAVNATQQEQVQEETQISTNLASCSSSCGNSCTAESNCGRSSCGAVSGGSCGCR